MPSAFAYRFHLTRQDGDLAFHASGLLTRGYPSPVESHLQPFWWNRVGHLGTLLSLGTNLLHAHGCFQHLFRLLTLCLRYRPALLVGDLPQPFSREVHSTEPFENLCRCFIRPRTAHQRRQVAQSWGDVVPLHLSQTALCRTIQLATGLTAQPLERHVHPPKTGQQHSALRSLSVELVASTSRAVVLLRFGGSNSLLECGLHRGSSCFLNLTFHLAERGGRCIQVDLERNYHTHGGSYLSSGVFLTVATPL